ncbi:hypothetical protein VTO73DRAFT_1716 [Trametes versicolor]
MQLAPHLQEYVAPAAPRNDSRVAKGSGIPPLCGSHRQEYCQQYKAYKDSSRVSEALSEMVWKLLQIIDWTCPIAIAMERAETALAATRRCIVALDKEICEREAHHKRFFTQVHPGHENWIYVLRKRRERVEDSAEKLRLQTMIATEAEAARLKALGEARNPFLYTHSFKLRVWTIPMMSMTPSIGDYNACDRRDKEHDKTRRMAVQTVTALAWYAKGTAEYVLSGGQDHIVRLWNPKLGTEIKRYAAHGYEVLSITV